jgi:hypothetical protein
VRCIANFLDVRLVVSNEDFEVVSMLVDIIAFGISELVC